MKRFNGLLFLTLLGLVVALGRAPQASAGVYNATDEVTYKEYWMNHKEFTAGCAVPGINDKPSGNSWYSEPDTLAKCPKLMKLTVPDNFAGAIKAELYVDLWRNYDTKSARLRINNNPNKVYQSPRGYDWSRTPWIQEIPLNELITGENVFLFWGESGKYHIHDVALRIYYDDTHPLIPGGQILDTEAPTGELISVQSLDPSQPLILAYDGGQLMVNQDKIELKAKVSKAQYVEFHAFYDGYDDDNDGITRDWHNVSRNNWWPGGKPESGVVPITGGTINHIGTVKINDPSAVDVDVAITWNLPHIVNQSGVKFKIKVVDVNGNVREAPGGSTPGYTLVRNFPVVYYTMPNFDDFGLHMSGNRPDSVSYTFPLPNDLNLGEYSTAYLVGMYWRVPQFTFNGTPSASVRQGGDQWELAVRPLNKTALLPGNNNITYLYANGTGHFIEYPGPMIVLRGNNTPNPDIQPPNIISRTPAPSSTNVDIFAPVSIRVGDVGGGIDTDTILMSVDGVPVTPVLSGPSNNLTATFTPTSPYPTEASIPVTFYACDLIGNCMLSADTFSFETEPPDLTPPIISNVLVNTTNSSATVTWMTNEGATSKVDYGLTNAYEKTPVSSNALVTSHSLLLEGLLPDTSYNFRLTSTDYFDNTAVTGNLVFHTKRDPGNIVSDDFASCTLDTAVWTYVNPKSDSILTLTGSGAQVAVPSGSSHDLWKSGLQAPRLMQFVTNQDFDVEVKFDSTLDKKTQTMGILVQQDSGNWLRFNFQNDGIGTNSLVVVNSAKNNPVVAFTTPVTIGAANYMRLNRAGDLWNLQYSTDGSNWTFATTITQALNVSEIGPFIGNTSTNPAFVGVVDYFQNMAAPIVPEDPPLQLNVTQVGVGTVTRVPDKTSYACNEQVQLTAAPATDWDFVGWSGAINSTNLVESITLTQTRDVVATFVNNKQYTLNVNVESQGNGIGGTVTKSPDQGSYSYGTEVLLTATPAPGWSFVGWSGDYTGANPASTVPVTGNMNITATFKEDEYTLDTLILADGFGEGGTITVDPVQPTYLYGEAVTLTVSVNPGWSFVGWEGEGVSGTATTLPITMTQNVVAIAHLTQNQYDLNVAIVNNGVGDDIQNAVLIDPEQPTYGYNQTITLTAVPELGWSFTGWSGDLTGTELTKSLTITEDNDITATFTQQQFAVNVTSSNPAWGTVTLSPQKDYYLYGEVVTVTPVPVKGYEFTLWTGDVTGSTKPLFLAITQDYTLEAVFQVDTTPIEIISQSVEVHGGTVAVITWETDVPGTSTVYYGETTFYEGGTEAKADLVTNHTITLTGLEPETFYHYQIESKDADGNTVQSDDLTFSTSSSSGLASDDFSSCQLSDRWTWVNPLNDSNYAVTGRQLEISVPAAAHNIWSTGIDAPRLMQPANDNDFTIEVKFDSNLVGLVAMQGILIQQDAQNFIRFDFYKRSPADTAQEINVYAASFENLTPRVRANNKVAEQLQPMYMRIVREGDAWTQLFSYNGTNWTENVKFTYDMTVTQVGVFAGNTPYKGETPAHTAVIDYFFNTASPIVPEDSFYQLDWDVEGSGTIEVNPDKPGYYCGEQVTLTAVGSPGWSFAGWADNTSSNPTRVITIPQTSTIIARFQEGDAIFRLMMPFVRRP